MQFGPYQAVLTLHRGQRQMCTIEGKEMMQLSV